MNGVIEYNLKSAKNYGWSSEWFYSEKFDETLIENIKTFQLNTKE